MGVARHQRPKELEGTPIDEIANRYIGRFHEKKPDWAAFEDAKIEGYKRAQHRFIGAGGSGKHGDTRPDALEWRLLYRPPSEGDERECAASGNSL